MPVVCPGVETSRYFPELYGFVPGAWNQVVSVKDKVDVTDVVIVAVEGLAAYVIIIQVP